MQNQWVSTIAELGTRTPLLTLAFTNGHTKIFIVLVTAYT